MRSVDDWFCSEETGQPFTHCVCCRFPLLEIDASWLVNKDFHRGECVLEYAVCQRCRDRVAGEFSEDSKAAVRRFLEQEIDWEARLAEFMAAAELTERLLACIACRLPRDQMEGFGISALFDSGGNLVTGPLPLLICRFCVGRMTQAYSEESRRIWRRFLDENFSGPPDDPGILGIF